MVNFGFSAIGGSGSDTKFTIKELEGDAVEHVFKFNPTSMKLSRSVEWQQQPTKELGAQTSFKQTKLASLSFSVLMDTTDNDESLHDALQSLYMSTEPTEMTDDEKYRPPLCHMQWNEFNFYGVIKSLEYEYKMFSATGDPKRVMVAIVMDGATYGNAPSPDDFFAGL